jgi:hypothetical protein
MKSSLNLTAFARGRVSACFLAVLLGCVSGLQSLAQQSRLPINSLTSTPWVNGSTPAFTVTQTNTSPGVSTWITPLTITDSSPEAIDNDLNDPAQATVAISGSASLRVADANTYNARNFVGFLVRNSSLAGVNLLGAITINTYLGNSTTPEETSTAASLLGVSSGLVSGATEVGFYTTKPYSQVEIIFTNPLTLITTYEVYYAVQRAYQAGPVLACNTPTALTAPAYPVVIDPANTGLSGVSVGSVNNTNNAIDADAATYAEIAIVAGVGGSGSMGVRDVVTTYPAGTFAGFDISSPALVGTSVLGGLRIETYLNGVATGDFFENGSTAGASVPLLSGTGRQTVGFLTSLPFDEVKLTVRQTVGVNVGTSRVYGAVFTRFCIADQLACNTLTSVTNPGSPVFVDGENTGITSIACTACTINNPTNVVDGDPANAATIVLAAGVASSGSFAVANALETYAPTSFAGFDVETSALLSAGALSSATISLYNNGTLVQTGTGNALIIGASSALLTGTSRQIVGIVATAAYDEVKIIFNQVAGADLGNIRIYGAIFDKLCAGTIACNNSYLLTQPSFPVVINAANTGLTGVTCAGCSIADPWNVVSASNADFSRVTLTANVAAAATLAVVDPIDTFPVGTAAGFIVNPVNTIAQLDLLNSITISTYNNGTFQESRTGSGLLNLQLLQTLTVVAGTATNVSFIASLPFDEIRIEFRSLAGAVNVNDVYGAFVDTRASEGGGALSCNVVKNPDFNVTHVNVPETGSVATNDKVPAGATYGPTATAGAGNPAGGTLTLNADGSGRYSFTATTTGTYTYQVPACIPNLGCTPVPLVITVVDPAKTTNLPAANTDITSVTGAAANPPSVTINVKVNDSAGNKNGVLADPAPSTPAHGTVAVVNGNVVYTPTAGYYGEDTFTYQICETPGTNLCTTATVYITVKQPGATNTTSAADDYVSTTAGTTATGSVSTNDSDPEGNTLTVTAQTVSNPAGTFTLQADGSFSFAPVSGFSGPVEFAYTTTDNGTPQASASATLHLLVNPSAPLPVTLTSFTVYKEGQRTLLTWTTTIETNSDRFEIERSQKGKNWELIGMQKSNGESTSLKSYSFQDAAPLQGENLYRIKMIDRDLTYAYSRIQSLTFGSDPASSFYPNPVAEKLIIKTGDFSLVKSVRIIDANGRTVYQSVGKPTSEINVQNLSAGLYIVQMVSKNGAVVSQKVIKQ